MHLAALAVALGHDAVAGVVNFIMNKNFEGVRIDAQYSIYQHGQHDDEIQSVVRAARAKGHHPLMLELPAYHWPHLQNLGLGLWERAKIFLSRVGTVMPHVEVKIVDPVSGLVAVLCSVPGVGPVMTSGVVTQVSMLSMFSHPGQSSPTKRGVALMDIFLCEPTPTPPANVDFSVINDTSGLADVRMAELCASSGAALRTAAEVSTSPSSMTSTTPRCARRATG